MKKFTVIVGFLLINAVAFAQEIDKSFCRGMTRLW